MNLSDTIYLSRSSSKIPNIALIVAGTALRFSIFCIIAWLITLRSNLALAGNNSFPNSPVAIAEFCNNVAWISARYPYIPNAKVSGASSGIYLCSKSCTDSTRS